MNNRQKMLLLFALISVALYLGGDWAYREYFEKPHRSRTSALSQIKKDIKNARDRLITSKIMIDRLDDWRLESLPGNVEVAQATYRSWLLDHATKSGLQVPSVEAGSVTSRLGQFKILNFNLRGNGQLESVTRFLHNFYQVKLLHQIQSLNLTPLGKSGDVDVSLTVQAISIPDTPNWDSLPQSDPKRLTRSSWDEYQVISRRNVFGYGGSSDPADQTVLTAVTAVNGTPEVWFTGESDKLFKFKTGDQLDFGRFHGKLVEVLQEDVILESSGERWLLSIGENFGQALPLPPEE